VICKLCWGRFGEQIQSMRNGDGLEWGQDGKEGITGTCILCTDMR
jgi:hypothetical protein